MREGAGSEERWNCKARSGRRAGQPCPRRRTVYEKQSKEAIKEKLTALLHHVTVDVLRAGFLALRRRAAPGIDAVTWDAYAEELEHRLQDLHRRVHGGTYRALPSRRVYIPKADGKQRPLGIAAIEDKIVQAAVVAILTPIYEAEFLGFSYGFRPGRSQHDALDAVGYGIKGRYIWWILDADIQRFLDPCLHCPLAYDVCSNRPGLSLETFILKPFRLPS